jgi:hypothetical protein
MAVVLDMFTPPSLGIMLLLVAVADIDMVLDIMLLLVAIADMVLADMVLDIMLLLLSLGGVVS